MANYDYKAYVQRRDGKTKTTETYPTAKGARGEALRFLAGHGGSFSISYRIDRSNVWTGGMLTGGEAATVSPEGEIRH